MSVTELDYRVELDAYSGPLDLLLYLVRRHEIDLNDIPVAKLADQYLRHLAVMKQINVEVAGEFLVMAATLLEIKSAMLLPRAAVAEGDESDVPVEGLDPRHELVQQLLAYKRFKDVAMELDERREAWEMRFPHLPARAAGRPAGGEGADVEGADAEGAAEPIEIDLEDAHVLDLCEAFARLIESIGQGPARHEVVYDDTPVSLHAADIVDRLGREGAMTLQQIFVGRSSRGEMIGLFLATLELVRQRQIRVMQDRIGGEIRLELHSQEERRQLQEQEDLPHDWLDPETGQVDYDWPSEQAKARAERRATMRVERFKKKKPGDEAADGDEDDIIDVDDDADHA